MAKLFTIRITHSLKGWLDLPRNRVFTAELQHINFGQDTVWFVPALNKPVPRWAAECLDWRR
jgi:hypothetical protein